ncbi:MAG: polysaccharide deacetylase family protein [bacterium]
MILTTRNNYHCWLFFALLLLLGGCKQPPASVPSSVTVAAPVVEELPALRTRLQVQFGGEKPQQWGENVPGVLTHLDTPGKVIALTFDACGPTKSDSGYDAALIDYLRKEKIPATLFLTGRWLDANPQVAAELAHDPLFEIENHGTAHRPCSVNGRSSYGIVGTHNVGEIVDEVEVNARRITALTGRKPQFYRSGTACYDEVAVQVVTALGYRVVGFNVNGDAGATFTAAQVQHALLAVPAGAVVICHMNHPTGQTARGLARTLSVLRQRGFIFVHLVDYPLQ